MDLRQIRDAYIDDVVGSDKTQKELCNYMANKMTEALVGSNVPKV